jgi:hypothetical protein
VYVRVRVRVRVRVCARGSRAYACAARLRSRAGSPMIAENRDFKGSFGFSEAPKMLLCKDTLFDANAEPRSSSAMASRTSRFFLRSETHSCGAALRVCLCVRAIELCVAVRAHVCVRMCCAVPCVCACVRTAWIGLCRRGGRRGA